MARACVHVGAGGPYILAVVHTYIVFAARYREYAIEALISVLK